MIVRGSWPYDGEDGRDPSQAFIPVAIVCAMIWVATTLALLVGLALKLFV